MSPTNEHGPNQEPDETLLDGGGGAGLRWIGWVLAAMVILCLILAAWVWFEILGDLP